MNNKNYRRGRRFEYKLKKELEKYGFLVVRSAGSRSPFDLVALNQSYIFFIQLKYNKKISKQEFEKFYDFAEQYRTASSIFLIAEGVPHEPIKFTEAGFLFSTVGVVREKREWNNDWYKTRKTWK
jgi:Holliday junction resolvase